MLISREEYSGRLTKSEKFSNVVLVTGIKGVGKTTLVRQWTTSNHKKCEWKNIAKFNHIFQSKEVLISALQEVDFIEKTLSTLSANWTNLDCVVWDDFHHLSKDYQNILINYLMTQHNFVHHIILSDEDITASSYPEIPKINIGPFSLDELSKLLKNYSEVLDINLQSTVEELHQKTSGIPLLVKLQLQAQDTGDAFISNLLHPLNTDDRKVLNFAALYHDLFSIKDLSSILEIDIIKLKLSLENLCSKYLMEKKGQGKYIVPRFIGDQIEKDINDQENSDIRIKILNHLLKETPESKVEILWHAIKARNPDVLISLLSDHEKQLITPDDLSKVSTEILKDFVTILEDFLAKEIYDARFTITLVRILARALFLLNKRDSAIELSNKFIFLAQFKNIQSLEMSYLKLDYVQYLNRINSFEAALNFINTNHETLSKDVQYLLLIEKFVASIDNPTIDNQIAISGLTNIIGVIEKEKRYDNSSKPIMAHAHFQLARAFYHKSSYEEAKTHYKLAADLFNTLRQPYYYSICLFNLGWIYIKSYQWQELQILIDKLLPIARKYGYALLVAGLNLLDARRARLTLQNNKSLDLIEHAIKAVGSSAPSSILEDLISEKIRILISLNQFQSAKSEFDNLSIKMQGKSEKLKLLKSELSSHELSIEDSIEEWEIGIDGQKDKSSFYSYLLQRGIEPADSVTYNYPVFQYAQTIFQTVQAYQSGQVEQVWPLIGNLENILNLSKEPCLELAGINTLQAALCLNEIEKKEFIQKAKNILQVIKADAEAKAPIECFIKKIENPNYDYQDDSLWQKSYLGEKSKWQILILPILSNNTKERMVIGNTSQDQSNKDDFQALRKKKGLLIIEELGEVWIDGKLISEFSRKHYLRKALVLLVESSPNPISKSEMSAALWGEDYNPMIHDPRIYTSILRLRDKIPYKDFIIKKEDGYVLSKKYSFNLVRPKIPLGKGNHRVETLLMNSLESFAKKGQEWISRGALTSATGIPEATVKRALSKLFSKNWVKRRGNGRSVQYSPATLIGMSM